MERGVINIPISELINRIFCTKCEDGFKLVEDNTVDLVVTSPPYDKMREYEGCEFDIDVVIKELYRVVKDGGVVVWVISDETEDKDESGTAFKHALKFKEHGFLLYDTMIFLKNNPPPKTHLRYEQCFEYMFVLSKGQPKTINLMTRECKKSGKIRKGNTYIQDGTDTFENQHKEGIVSKTSAKYNVWSYSVGNAEMYRNIVKRDHPAKFPISLARDHILSWSNKGAVVLDPFMGSGTTAIASILTERLYIGFEKSEEYCARCTKYIAELYEKIEKNDKAVQRFKKDIDTIEYKDLNTKK